MLDRKMNDPFSMASTSSITMQSLGKIVQRAPAAGAKWCLLLCFFLSVTLRVRITVRSRVHSSNKHCTAVYCPISTQFSAFFIMNCSFRSTTQFAYSSHVTPATIFAKLRSKIAKSPKIGDKVCAHHFVQIADRFEENFNFKAVVQGGMCRCATI